MVDEYDEYDLSEFTQDDFAAIDAHVARISQGGPTVEIAIESNSPFRRFRSSRNYFAVVDLVSPLWCELQYEYSLYGKRHRPFPQRPRSFTSRSGNKIDVQQQVARANDRRLKRGKSIHKALENELRPEKIDVRTTSDEERFALRLVQLIDGLNELVCNGITRELPVFAITHTQVVLGVIDEVLLSPLPQGSQHHTVSPASTPGTPSTSPPKKKQRLQEIDPLIRGSSNTTALVDIGRVETTSVASACIPANLCELRIIDYKTRRSPTIPLDQDSLSPRLQLMMYHRMLSHLLDPGTFNFDLLWTRLSLNPIKPLSSQFLKDIAWRERRAHPTDSNVHLERLVSEWISTVQQKRPRFVVSQELKLIYRRSVPGGEQQRKGRENATERADVDDPLEALAFQEELDLARVIEESFCEIGHDEAGQVAHRVAQNVKQARPSFAGRTSAVWQDLISPLEPGQPDFALAWAIQQSLLNSAHEVCANVSTNKPLERDDDSLSDGIKLSANQTSEDISPIIGTKEFRMNDDELDVHLADVLQWWLGARTARGVDVGQTHHCFTCEYQESCEWRAQKAREANTLARERRVQR